ncbi:LacI family transcriptional regulator [Streptomyces tauricus]|uniref:LacI family transcriptional regulator n=1 Tax=Streptomyces tauricus TaxID=68274 RepID=A0ABZ1J7Y9_9ACTN|nr:LacI family DNA-binding transcriptional regulator [Streptomyces tauricus]MCW8098146.1 LacI family transcriptional regulator [Streptomyces tauricus]GHA10093.1 LacI family transcriptional regulator [Streptomyces tauricus]
MVEQPRKGPRRGRTPAATGRTSRPRQAEVARLAGVSQATVSLVLSAKAKAQGSAISDETRQRVLDAARSLGYVPDPAAQRLAAARNNLLGVYSFTATFPTDVEHSYYPFLVGVEREAAARGYDLVLFTGSSSGGAKAAGPEALNRVRLADGCLFLGRHVPIAELKRMVADGFPVVHLGRREELEGLSWVGADYVSASSEVVRHLAALGHRRIVLVREDDDAPASTDRQQGFLEGLEAAGLPGGSEAVFRCADPGREVTPERLRSWIAEGVTAFVAEETDTGGAWRALRTAVDEAGLSCPDDLSLALLGSPPSDLAGDPQPTGFDVPRHQLGAAAVRMLAALVAGEAAEEPLVACAFRAGATTGGPPGPR